MNAQSKKKSTKNSVPSSQQPTLDEHIWNRLLMLDRRILAKSVTYLESQLWSEVKYILPYWIKLQHQKRAALPVVAFTGTPGAGKSTFLNCLGSYILKKKLTSSLALFTVDPSSPLSGGSLLGDKARMDLLAQEERCFIRPSPSMDSEGSVSPKTLPVMKFFSQLPFEYLWLETIGVGQREQLLFSVADRVVLLLSPATGDDLQALKKGLLEQVDLIIVTKADGELATVAKKTAQFYKELNHRASGREIPVLLWSSQEYHQGQTDKIESIYQSLLLIEKNNEQKSKTRLEQKSMEELLLVPVMLRQWTQYGETQLLNQIKCGQWGLSTYLENKDPFSLETVKSLLMTGH